MPASQKGPYKKFLQAVKVTVTEYRMLEKNDSILVAVSGGPDSAALLHVLNTLAHFYYLKLGIIHLNHSLRGSDSDRDATFVQYLSKKYNLPLYSQKKDIYTYKKKNKLSLEEAARQVRYNYFIETAKEHSFNKIAVGHNKNDNAELILMNLFRGSGTLGISGIPPVRDNIIRPLINIPRSQILEYLGENKLDYVSDDSNYDTGFLRNRIRHELLPLLAESYNPNIIQALNRLGSIIKADENWIDEIIKSHFEKTVSVINPEKLSIPVGDVKTFHIAVARRIIRKSISEIKGDLRRITQSHIDAIINLVENKDPFCSLDLPDRIRITKNEETLFITKEEKPLRSLKKKPDIKHLINFEYSFFVSGFKPQTVFIKEACIKLEFSKTDIKNYFAISNAGQETAFLDMNRLSFPLTIRNQQHGDCFKPFGMNGTQKISRYFSNNKIPASQRLKSPVLLSGNKIVWVVGHRIDEAFKVTDSTENILKIEVRIED